MSNRPGPLAQRIAAEIRAELGRQNHSRRWLAAQIGENHVTVNRWVNGDGPVGVDSLDAICRALGITVADLLVAVERTNTTPAPRVPTKRLGRAITADVDTGSETSRDNHRYSPLLAA